MKASTSCSSAEPDSGSGSEQSWLADSDVSKEPGNVIQDGPILNSNGHQAMHAGLAHVTSTRPRQGIILPRSRHNTGPEYMPPPSQLMIVKIDDILIHEIHDPSRTDSLTAALKKDGIQRHPVIVAGARYGPFVHLDGANRLTALRRLGYEYVAVQVLNYADDAAVRLYNWVHLVVLNEVELTKQATRWPNCELRQLQESDIEQVLNSGAVAAVIMFSNGRVFGLLTDIGLGDRVAAIQALTNLYPASPVRETLSNVDSPGIQELLDSYPQAQACIAFTPITKQDVITLACNMETRIPAGITRHVVTCGRILGVDVPLQLLGAPTMAEQKTIELAKLLEGVNWRQYEPTLMREHS